MPSLFDVTVRQRHCENDAVFSPRPKRPIAGLAHGQRSDAAEGHGSTNGITMHESSPELGELARIFAAEVADILCAPCRTLLRHQHVHAFRAAGPPDQERGVGVFLRLAA